MLQLFDTGVVVMRVTGNMLHCDCFLNEVLATFMVSNLAIVLCIVWSLFDTGVVVMSDWKYITL